MLPKDTITVLSLKWRQLLFGKQHEEGRLGTSSQIANEAGVEWSPKKDSILRIAQRPSNDLDRICDSCSYSNLLRGQKIKRMKVIINEK